MSKKPKYILVMKVGPFCGFSLEEIVTIKQKEEEHIGKFFLGYSGVFCHQKRVSEFVKKARSEGERVTVYFITTPSNFSSPIERLTEYSLDGELWQGLPQEVLLVGSKFSIVAKGLRSVDEEIDLAEYVSMLGVAPGKRLHEYLRYRCDKACAMLDEASVSESKKVAIAYTCELAEEGVVYVK